MIHRPEGFCESRLSIRGQLHTNFATVKPSFREWYDTHEETQQDSLQSGCFHPPPSLPPDTFAQLHTPERVALAFSQSEGSI